MEPPLPSPSAAPVLTTEPPAPLHDSPLWQAHDAAMKHLNEVAARRDYSEAGEQEFSNAVIYVRLTFAALLEGGA